MSVQAHMVVVSLPGGDTVIGLDCGALDELQRRCSAGVPTIAKRLFSRDWRIADVSSVLELAVQGGGLGPVAAGAAALAAMQRLRTVALPAAQAAMAAAFAGLPEGEGERRSPGGPIDFARFRAKFLEFGVAPAAVDSMGLGQLLATFEAFGRKGTPAPSDEEYDEIIAALRSLGDPSIRVH